MVISHFAGYQVKYPGPNRDKLDKWYMPREKWPYDNYPPWFQGLAYFLTPSLAEKLVPIALNVPYFFMDDVYIGVLVSQVSTGAEIIMNQNLSASAAMTRYSIDYFLSELWSARNATFYHMPNMERYWYWYTGALERLRVLRENGYDALLKWSHHL